MINVVFCRPQSQVRGAMSTAEKLEVVIHGKVYDFTEFADRHPGGVQILCVSSSSFLVSRLASLPTTTTHKITQINTYL